MYENLNGEILILRSNHGSRDFLTRLNKLRESESFIDVTLMVENERIKAHKLILCSCSPYFEKMFDSGFMELNSNEVKLQGFNFQSLQDVVNFMYNGLLKVTWENVADLLFTVDILLMEQVRGSLFRYLQQIITTNNCLNVLKLGNLYCSKEVQSSAKRFLRRNYEDVMKNEDKDKLSELLSREDLEFVIPNSNDLNLKSRNYCYVIAAAFDSKEIEYLDLDNMEDGWNVLTEIPGMRYGLCGASMSSHNGQIHVTGGVGKDGIMTALPRHLIYDLRSNTWSSGPSLSIPRKCHGSLITRDNKLMIVGGTDSEGNPIHDGEILDLSDDKCFRKISGIGISYNISLKNYDGNKIIALSNYGGTCDREYDCENSRWVEFNYERLNRDHPGVGCDQRGNVIVAGGNLNGEKIKNCRNVRL